MGESDTVVSAYTLYRHLQQYCSHPSNCGLSKIGEDGEIDGQGDSQLPLLGYNNLSNIIYHLNIKQHNTFPTIDPFLHRH